MMILTNTTIYNIGNIFHDIIVNIYFVKLMVGVTAVANTTGTDTKQCTESV
jgi:Ca2+/Na+ antiporter